MELLRSLDQAWRRLLEAQADQHPQQHQHQAQWVHPQPRLQPQLAPSLLLAQAAVCSEIRPDTAATDSGQKETRLDTEVPGTAGDKNKRHPRRPPPPPRAKDAAQQTVPAPSLPLLDKDAQGLGCAE